MVTLASQLHPQLEFRVGNAEALPFPDDSFQVLVANFLLQHLPRPEQAAAEFFRVLLPGGRLALTVWDVPERNPLIGVFIEAVAEVGAEPLNEVPIGPPPFRFSDEHELVRLFREQRFVDINVETITLSQTVASPDEFWRGFLAGTLSAAALVRSQTEDLQHRLRITFDRLLQPYRLGDRLELPLVVKLASATKPPT
jgi:SAM-dependent methyltransferase